MIQIRQGVFETNSSSTHAISICSGEQWDGLKSGAYWTNLNLDVLPKDEAIAINEEIRKEAIKKGWDPEDAVMEDGYMPYEELYDEYEYEWYNERSTINGVDVVAFGYYGYDY